MKNLSIAFLLSNWYSGATLLSLLVNQHKQIITNGEGFYHPNAGADTMCSCGKTVRECSFYKRAAASMWSGDDFDRKKFAVIPQFSENEILNRILSNTRWPGRWRRSAIYAFPNTRKQYMDYIEHHVEFMKNAASIAGASIYFDGTKSIRRAEMFLSEDQYKFSPIVLLVRDPLSWCASWIRNRPDKRDIDRAIWTWTEYLRRSFLLKECFPTVPFLVVRYEDLCECPKEQLDEIESFLGLPEQISKVLENKSYQIEGQHVLGNNMRFTFDGKIKKGKDRSEELFESEKIQVLQKCAPWMEKLGYANEG